MCSHCKRNGKANCAAHGTKQPPKREAAKQNKKHVTLHFPKVGAPVNDATKMFRKLTEAVKS